MTTSPEIEKLKLRYDIVGKSEGLHRALEVALKVAPIDLSVLIQGENGVGKEVFPRLIHEHSLRKTKRYFAVNCGAIPEGTIDSELFGHEKGAFTGAIEQREGYFAAADGGTLFLDEVGELPLATQARLLRVLETGEYIRVGSSEVRKTNVRIVAATNLNVEKAVEEGKFREDLYYRLNTISITVPPLRERGDDALLLFKKFSLEMSEKYRMPPIRLVPEAQRLLMAYSWPGNVRQLKNITESMSVTASSREITPEILHEYLPRERRHGELVAVPPEQGKHSFENEREILYKILFDLRRDVNELKKLMAEKNEAPSLAQPSTHGDIQVYRSQKNTPPADKDSFLEIEETDDMGAESSLSDIERLSIQNALTRYAGNRREAAQALGISERTLYRKIKTYGLA